MMSLRYERAAWRSGLLLIGVDEVGRGPLAGPVVAAAVCFPRDHRSIDGVRDSKLVTSAERRADLVRAIREGALAIGLGAASVREIAQLNIRRATALAMRRALARCRACLPEGVQTEIVIDGLPMPEVLEVHRAMVGGDGLCHSIAAASLVAKVARDRLMGHLALRRPGYGWETNVGYGTAAHIAALHSLGLTPHHRVQFCATAIAQSELFP